jgi:hypothetical protein
MLFMPAPLSSRCRATLMMMPVRRCCLCYARPQPVMPDISLSAERHCRRCRRRHISMLSPIAFRYFSAFAAFDIYFH